MNQKNLIVSSLLLVILALVFFFYSNNKGKEEVQNPTPSKQEQTQTDANSGAAQGQTQTDANEQTKNIAIKQALENFLTSKLVNTKCDKVLVEELKVISVAQAKADGLYEDPATSENYRDTDLEISAKVNLCDKQENYSFVVREEASDFTVLDYASESQPE